jgi:hypothetical protein
MLEHCDYCLTLAPEWDAPDYAEWHLGVDEHGAYLGVVCPNCFAAEGLCFIAVEAPGSERAVGRLSIVSSSSRSSGEAESSSARSMPAAA